MPSTGLHAGSEACLKREEEKEKENVTWGYLDVSGIKWDKMVSFLWEGISFKYLIYFTIIKPYYKNNYALLGI